MIQIQGAAPARLRWQRLALLLLTLLAFARLTFALDGKDLWLDEGFSVQRAESDWSSLLRGTLHILDGSKTVETIDQHPFAYFAMFGAFLRLAGESEYALRMPSVLAGTLLVAALWALARRLQRHRVLPPSAPMWAALLAALNPFYLWYGQEVRMYELVALTAVLSTYFLLCWAESRRRRRVYLAAYVISVALLLSSHYYSVFILPVHAAIVYVSLEPAHRRRALWAAGGVLALGVLAAVPAALQMMHQPGAGANFVSVSLRVLVPDLVNAFTLGLSVDLAQVWPIDVLSALVVIVGITQGFLARPRPTAAALLLPALLIVPVILLAGVNFVRPAYMNARHMSLVSGAYLLLLAGGLAWLWQQRRWLGALVAAVLVGGVVYSSYNYFVQPTYAKGDMRGIGSHLAAQLQPGDLLLIEPAYMYRLFRYYLPIDKIQSLAGSGAPVAWHAAPVTSDSSATPELVSLASHYRRVWLARALPDSQTANWLLTHTFRAQDWGYQSPLSVLRLELFIPGPMAFGQLPAGIQHPVDVKFGDAVRLVGYDVGAPLVHGGELPVTLYWQALRPLDKHYKYILRSVQGEGRQQKTLAHTEREPYDGLMPTTAWAPGNTIREFSGVSSMGQEDPSSGQLLLQMYDAETLQKLPITGVSGVQVADENTLVLSP